MIELGPEFARARMARKVKQLRSQGENGRPYVQQSPDIDALVSYLNAKCPSGERAQELPANLLKVILEPVSKNLTHGMAYEIITGISRAWRHARPGHREVVAQGQISVELRFERNHGVISVRAPGHEHVVGLHR